MFPLGTMLLPGSGLPLQVFEPRYRQMVRDILADDGAPEFGQVLITHGREAGGGDLRSDVGTRARMVDIQAVGDGRYTFVAVGVERIRVLEWMSDDPYPRARVEPWPDERTDGVPQVSDDVIAAAAERVLHLLGLAARLAGVELSDAEGPVAAAIEDPALATYRLAALAPIGPADHYRVLCAGGPVERLEALSTALDDAEAMLKFRLS